MPAISTVPIASNKTTYIISVHNYKAQQSKEMLPAENNMHGTLTTKIDLCNKFFIKITLNGEVIL